VHKVARFLVRRVPWALGFKVIASLLILVYAANITATTNNFQAQFGSSMNIANGLLATDKGFSVSATAGAAAGTSCGSPVIFAVSTSKTANTTITAGHLVYDVQVNATSSAPTNHNFNVTLFIGSTPYGPLCIKTLLAPLGGTIDCRFDIPTALPVSPYTFKVTIGP
jgi:hypothetical protein